MYIVQTDISKGVDHNLPSISSVKISYLNMHVNILIENLPSFQMTLFDSGYASHYIYNKIIRKINFNMRMTWYYFSINYFLNSHWHLQRIKIWWWRIKDIYFWTASQVGVCQFWARFDLVLFARITENDKQGRII